MDNKLISAAEIFKNDPKLISINDRIKKNIREDKNRKDKIYSGKTEDIESGCRFCGVEKKEEIIKLPYPLLGQERKYLVDNCKCWETLNIQAQVLVKSEFSKRKELFEKLLKKSNIPDKFKKASFAGADIARREEPLNFKKVLYYAKSFDPTKGEGLSLYGNIGRAKTYLSACLANHLMEKGISVCFVTYYQITQEHFDNKKIMNDITKADLVIVDEFGAVNLTPHAMDILARVVNDLYERKKAICLNMNPDVWGIIKKTPQLNKVRDRILEMCPTRLEFKGESLRGK